MEHLYNVINNDATKKKEIYSLVNTKPKMHRNTQLFGFVLHISGFNSKNLEQWVEQVGFSPYYCVF